MSTQVALACQDSPIYAQCTRMHWASPFKLISEHAEICQANNEFVHNCLFQNFDNIRCLLVRSQMPSRNDKLANHARFGKEGALYLTIPSTAVHRWRLAMVKMEAA